MSRNEFEKNTKNYNILSRTIKNMSRNELKKCQFWDPKWSKKSIQNDVQDPSKTLPHPCPLSAPRGTPQNWRHMQDLWKKWYPKINPPHSDRASTRHHWFPPDPLPISDLKIICSFHETSIAGDGQGPSSPSASRHPPHPLWVPRRVRSFECTLCTTLLHVQG